jgi:hypothetical protein
MAKKEPSFIQFRENGINYGFHAHYKKEGNMYSWYIPSFDIFFSSKTKEEGDRRAIAMTTSFFNQWIHHESFRSFILQIHKLGFRAPEHHEYKIKQLLNREKVTGKFRAKDSYLPNDFIDSDSIEQEGNVEMAM